MSGLAAVVGFPSSRIRISVRWERFFSFLVGLGSEILKPQKISIESNPLIPSFWLYFWYFILL